MKLFIHIAVGHWQEDHYDNPWLHFASSLSSDIMGTDLDNESEAFVAELVVRLLEQSDRVCVLIQSRDPKQTLGPSAAILLACSKHQDKVHRIILQGSNADVVARATQLKFTEVVTDDEIKDIIRGFAQ